MSGSAPSPSPQILRQPAAGRAHPPKTALLGAGVLVGLGLGFLILAGLGLMGRLPDWFGGGSAAALGPSIDKPALDFTLDNLAGETVSTLDLRGKTVLLNFWATWCIPCRQEMPMLQAAAEKYAPNLVVLGINIGEEPWRVKKIVYELGLSFEILMDESNQVETMYRVRAYPTTYLIDDEGIIRAQHVGLLTETQLEKYLERVDLP
ncbi:MAG TPA: TlpA disulfide reductase family protein [Anaerolineales bacterium]|nr:TlpA disulfide reductase family protein [Anaerolineales bacterium]